MGNNLNKKQNEFVKQYLIDLNGTQAAIRAGYSANTANEQSSRLLANVNVQRAIQVAMQERSERTNITADQVLKLWWETATLDVNQLIEYRRTNCRHCWGIDHQYQWDESEYLEAVNDAESKGKNPPNCIGGLGFAQNADANPDCPKCFGEGRGHIHVHDTRKLRGAARRAYAGVQMSKEGLKVNVADRDKALENVARHLGMFNDKVSLTIPQGVSVSATSAMDPGQMEELRKAIKDIADKV
ncbi:terminase small subunit [Undibacterium sp. MH2W]|uniref:terminase small subunit n=1 Tax=Undibacterium sp. MH2W TaxID=3413044 RepID=UPI003BF114DB